MLAWLTEKQRITALCIEGRVLYVRTPTDIDTHKRTRTNAHGRGRRRMDADSDERKPACVPSVGGRIVQTHPALKRTFKDLRDVLYIHMSDSSFKIDSKISTLQEQPTRAGPCT